MPITWAVRVAAYRLLIKGQSVTLENIAQASGRDVVEVERCLRGRLELSDDGRVEAVMGLSLRPTQHRILIGNTQLYVWCALDLLFIPRTLGLSAEIESPSPASGQPVRGVVTPSGIEDLQPDEAVVSVIPTQPESSDIRGAFCNFVHFFTSTGDAAQWQESHPDGWVLPADEAFQLGARFVEGLGEDCGDCCA